MLNFLFSFMVKSLFLLLLCSYLPARAAVFDEVIVTAEKRYESLQGLSQSVTTFTSRDLENKHINSFVDLSVIAPSVIVAKNEGFKTVIAIRGVGNEANQNVSANPSVSYHFDGVYVASPYALQTTFFDLERIEILRGPQATVFGQNATGGAINIITKEPNTIEFDGNVDVMLGEYNRVRLRGYANVPLSESAAMRISVARDKHDGFSKNIVLGQELDEADNISGRVRLLWSQTDELIWHVTAQYFHEDTNGAAQKGILDPTTGERRLAQDSLSSYELTAELFSIRAEWSFENFTFNYVGSYQNDEISVDRDNDRNDINTLPPFALLPAYFNPEDNKQQTITQEIYLVSEEMLFDRIDWMAGIFYLNTEVDVLIRERLDFNFDGIFAPFTVAQVQAFGGEVGFISDSIVERTSFSIYGRGTYNVSDDFRVIAGLRYTEDEVNAKVSNFFGRAGTSILEPETDAITGRVAAEYDISGSAMLYGFYTQSFKPGGSNLTFGREDVIGRIIVLPTYEDEHVDAFELGIKSDWFGSRMRINAAAFFYTYENMQFQATDPEVFEGGVGNVPESEIYGFELEFLAYLTDNLSLDAKMGIRDTEVTESFLSLDNVKSEAATNALICCGTDLFSAAVQQARAAQVEDLKGNELAKSPRITMDLSLHHVSQISSWGRLATTLQYTYRDEMQQRIFNNPIADNADSYDTWNLSFNFDPPDSRWGLDLYVINVTDEHGANARFTDVFGVAATSEELIPPRQILARFRWAF